MFDSNVELRQHWSKAVLGWRLKVWLQPSKLLRREWTASILGPPIGCINQVPASERALLSSSTNTNSNQ